MTKIAQLIHLNYNLIVIALGFVFYLIFFFIKLICQSFLSVSSPN